MRWFASAFVATYEDLPVIFSVVGISQNLQLVKFEFRQKQPGRLDLTFGIAFSEMEFWITTLLCQTNNTNSECK